MTDNVPYEPDGDGARTLELLEGAEHYNRWLFEWLEPHLGELNCELGAGQGTLTRFALEKHHVIATEPSSTGRQQLHKRFGDHPRLVGIQNDFFDVPGEGKLDCVYSANVLEHIPDDVGILEHASRVLRPGGRFVAVVPAGGWLYSKFDAKVGHYRRYTRADRTRLDIMLEQRRIPMAITTFRHRNPAGALGWFMAMRCLRRETIAAEHVRMAETLVPIFRALDQLRAPIGQSLVLELTRQ